MSQPASSEDTRPILAKAYEPAEVEAKWASRWAETQVFKANPESTKPAYSIVIPPPNVTGVLHLGHVLNNTLQDILARRARATGHEVLWLPGTDHAGIATQTMVEKQLRKEEGKTRRDLGREAFLERVWQWKEKHGGIIINQLKRLGCSLDWSRERFTMDPDYTKEVQKVFISLFEKGLIYRGRRMVNWCPASLTALSDEEVIPTPQKSKLYTFQYEIVEHPGQFLQIATTRPETVMGDVAVAVHPEDPRYKHLIGCHVWRAFPRTQIPIIGDDALDPEFGTGVLKVTPAHDVTDYEIGLRHQLPILDILHPDGRIHCPEVPELDGIDRFTARKKAAEMLEELGALVAVKDYENTVGFSERAGVPIEPRLSLQWFLKYPCTEETTRAVADDTIQFRPERWKKTFAHWMENLKDWCISRQLWWGHRIPVWYRKDKATALQESENLDASAWKEGDLHVGTTPPEDPENWVQDEDSLDTWFSSWLWPFATMDEATRAKFYPTSDLVTGPDIIFFWVARMIMAGYEFEGKLPFKNVYFTSIVRDKQGRKMSKTLGNSPDPIDLMAKYGADGMRFGLLRIAPSGADVKFDEKQIEEGRNFANKLWNAVRFRQMQGDSPEGPLDLEKLSIYHLDILAKLDELGRDLKQALENYEFQQATSLLYHFFWSEYCDWFLESVKGELRSATPSRDNTLRVMDCVLRRFIQHLHPFMPHLTEELWETLSHAQGGTLLSATLLDQDSVLQGIEEERVKVAQERVRQIHEAVGRVRNLKAEYNLAANKEVKFEFRPAPTAEDWAPAEFDTFLSLVGGSQVTITSTAPSSGTPAVLTELGEIFMPLLGFVDLEAERARLEKEIAKTEQERDKSKTKLERFGDRTPENVIAQEKRRLEEWEARLQQLIQMRNHLG